MSLTNPDDVVTKEVLAEFYQGILPYLGKGGGHSEKNIMYGFRINHNESVPSAKVTYLSDALGMTPAHMDYTTGKFDYGSWKKAFFMPKPCMLKYDGTVDYYLDPDDYSKKEDGTASDVDDPTYQGNAMMEWGRNGRKIWTMITPDPTASNWSANVYIANYQVSPEFTDWPFHNEEGLSVDHFYTPIYNSSLQDGKLRSLSDQQVINSGTFSQQKEYAEANNPTGKHIWTMEVYSDITLINFLLILMGKSTDTQTVFGRGLCTGGTEVLNNAFRTGIHDDKGLFYGTDSGTASTYTNAVKVFGMENWWGFQIRRFLGEVRSGYTLYLKLTYGREDGTTTDGYNLTGSGYISAGNSQFYGTYEYIERCIFNKYGMFPYYATGNSTTNYCDGLWYDNSGTRAAARSGASNSGDECGAFLLDIWNVDSNSNWAFGACLSAKPLS